jgi:hypothetical protein
MSDPVLVAAIMGGSTAISALLQFLTSRRVKEVQTKLQEVHEDVNGSLANMRRVELAAERILGIAEGREMERRDQNTE